MTPVPPRRIARVRPVSPAANNTPAPGGEQVFVANDDAGFSAGEGTLWTVSKPGDTVTCGVGGIGELTNPVTAAGRR